MSSPKKWWHFVRPRQFYQCYVLGSGPPVKKWRTRGRAMREAARLAEATGLPTYVLATVAVVKPAMPSPAPEFEIDEYDTGVLDYANVYTEVGSRD